MLPKTVALVNGTNHLVKTVKQYLSDTYDFLSVKSHWELKGKQCFTLLLYHAPPIHFCLNNLHEITRRFLAPVIVLTEPVAPGEVVELFRLGAKDVLFLPLQSEELTDSIFRQGLPLPGKNKTGWKAKIGHWLVPLSLHTSIFSQQRFMHPFAEIPVKQEKGQEALADLQVQFLGPFSIFFKGEPLRGLSGKKAKTLLAYLLFKYPKHVQREILIEKFWGDSTPDSARNCLNVTLHAIRKCFEQIAPGENVLLYQDESYCLNPELLVERDIDLFESYWKKGRHIERQENMEAAMDTYHQAFAFYRGDFLEDLLFEEWAERERERFRETWLVILDRLSAHFFEKGRYQICLNLCRRMLEKDTCLEEAHRRLMECYVHLGMRDKAIRQYQKCSEQLLGELNVLPGKATEDLYRQIREN